MTAREFPTIGQADVQWVCNVMGLPQHAFGSAEPDDSRFLALTHLDGADFEACPGSGKTTLLVAKLAILANKWAARRHGICVLSHTNAARNEIGSRLRKSATASAILRYPHFVGTIHSFVNEFIALPALRSKGMPIKVIDTESVLERRWRMLPFKTRVYLEKRGLDKYALSYTRPDFGGGNKGGLAEHTDTYRTLADIARRSSLEGRYCYDEMFVWANELLSKRGDVVALIRERFPLVFIDEAQDNSELQSMLLGLLFNASEYGNPSVRQRFGDSNQAIYQYVGQSGATTDIFPGSVKFDLPRSYRFGQVIADHAKAFGVEPQALVGAGPSNSKFGVSRPPVLLLFDDESVGTVLSRYGEVLLRTFSGDQLASGVFTAVSAVHKDSERTSPVPISMRDYAPTYDAACARRNENAATFYEFLRRARYRFVKNHGDTQPLVSGTAEAVLQLSSILAGDDIVQNRRVSAHRRVNEMIAEKPAARAAYTSLVQLVIDRRGDLTFNDWLGCGRGLALAAARGISGCDEEEADAFLEWSNVYGKELPDDNDQDASNTFAFPPSDPKVVVRLGSIHSVKGETHVATLVLDSYYYKHHLVELKPWLLGDRIDGRKPNGKPESDRLLSRLRLHYVALTRPSHLLCLAMHHSAFDDDELARLKSRGWIIEECQSCWDSA